MMFTCFTNGGINSFRYDSSLINGRGRWKDQLVPLTTFGVNPGETYRFRMSNGGCERGFVVSVDDHSMRVVALEGVDMAPLPVDSFMIFPGESLDFEMDANKTEGHYWIRAVTLRHGKGHDPKPDGIVNGVKAILRYGDVDTNAEPTSTPRDCTSSRPCRVFNCPFGGYPDSEHKICLKVSDAHVDVANEDFRARYGLTEPPAVVHFLNWNGVVGSSVNARRFVYPKIPIYLDYQVRHKPTKSCLTYLILLDAFVLPHLFVKIHVCFISLLFFVTFFVLSNRSTTQLEK